MLKGLDNRLTAEVLFALRAMGHGDTLVLADTNFPADSLARQTVQGRVIHRGAEYVLVGLPDGRHIVSLERGLGTRIRHHFLGGDFQFHRRDSVANHAL